MLWILLTANSDYRPTQGVNPSNLLGQITTAVAAVRPGWNWPGLKPANALTVVKAAVDSDNSATCLGPFPGVGGVFDALVANNSPWPPQPGNPVHPSAAELVDALSIT